MANTINNGIGYYIKEGWNEGMSEDDSLGGQRKCLFSSNIDLTGNYSYIELLNKPVKRSYTNAIYNLLEVTDFETNATNIFGFGSNGTVYKAGSDTPVYNNSRGNLDLPVFTFIGNLSGVLTRYIYFITSGSPYKLNRQVISSSSGTWGSVELNYKELAAPTSTEYSGVITRGNSAYIWLGNQISVFTSTAGLDSVKNYDISGGEEIAGITYLGGYFRIYTHQGKLLLWDGSSSTITESINIGVPVERVYQIGQIDYMITGSLGGDTGLYIMNGYTPQIIVQNKLSGQLDKQKFLIGKGYNTSITSKMGKIFFIDESVENEVSIASYGKDLQGLNNAYTLICDTASTNKKLTAINSVLYSGGYLYYSYQDISGQNGIDRILIKGNSTKQPVGTLISNINDLQQGILSKGLTGLYFRVKDITATQYIEVYLSYDGGDYNLVHTINTQPTDDIARIPLTQQIKDYSLMFKLYSDSSISPKLYSTYNLKYNLGQTY